MSVTTEFLRGRGVPFEAVSHEKAFTSIDEARALGIQADDVIKTLLLDTPTGHVLTVIPGDRRLDMKLVERAVGVRRAHLASEAEIEREYPEFELGCLPPIGSLLRVPEYVDADVMKHTTVMFAAGSQTESVKIGTEDLFGEEQIIVAPLTRQPVDE
jgi:prolyl-tRNA editing enzyme YbaK/EbsC (Cys-tRNA(Pro) deacylase)